MKSLMNSLSLQALFMSLAICLTDGAPYSKYGRSCKDIGCLPREVCVMAYDSCSFNQQENVSCGRYPTCKKVTDVQGSGMANGGNTQQNSGPNQYNPSVFIPQNTVQEPPRITFSDPIIPPPPPALNPNLVFGQPQNNNGYAQNNNYKPPSSQLPAPQMPLDIPRLPDNRQPFPASPNNQNYYPYHPDLTPPPNVFGPFRNNFVTTTREPSLLQQFLNNKNASTINHANFNLTLIGFLSFLLVSFLRHNIIVIA